LKKVQNLLVSVIPDITSPEDIKIISPQLVNKRIRQVDVSINSKHGNQIPFKDFSLGYKTVMAWLIDLAWRMINKYPKSKNPLEEPAIVLIDEIDLHLHPLWQRKIIRDISSHFPKVQFIATAHSPLMVQSAYNANFAVLKYDDDCVEVINEPEGIDGWRVDQILTSELFDLKSARGEEYEKIEFEREQLVQKSQLSPSEIRKLKRLDNKIAKLPTSETAQEIEERELVEQIIAKLKPKK
jgi:predicted ATP-binding protein involved in virulence